MTAGMTAAATGFRRLTAKASSYAMFKGRTIAVNATRPFMIGLAFMLARLSRTRPKASSGTRSALLLPTADPGNLGDEAYFWAMVEELRRQGFQRICVISFRPDNLWQVPGAETQIMALHHNPAGSAYLKFVRAAESFSHFYVWGADILDGSQGLRIALPRLRLASLAVAAGLRASVCSFSLNASPAPAVIAAFKRLDHRVALYCRDEISQSRLNERLTAERAALSADVAFLLAPDRESSLSRKAAAWIDAQRQSGRVIIGLNINDMLCYYFPDLSPGALVDQYVAIFEHLSRIVPNIAIVHVPHNIHPNETMHGTDDFQLAQAFEQRLPTSLRGHTFMLPRTVRATEIRAICGLCDFLFSGRMHLTIASLAQGTPVFGVAYQGKFEGLFRHFGIRDAIVTRGQLAQPDQAAALLADGIGRLPELRGRIQARLPAVLQLARDNLALPAPPTEIH